MDYEVLIVGGGIHGVGLMHDLASRRVRGVHLVEEKALASGTSSRSTKLVHGGLRYLEHLGQWSLVHEALRERGLLLRLLNGIVRPLPFVLPAFKGDRPPWMLRCGLFLYDMLAGDGGLPRSRRLTRDELRAAAPYLKEERIDKDMDAAFLYYDAQMLDDVIVKIAAAASLRLGASYDEGTRAVAVDRRADGQGYSVELEGPEGARRACTARIVVNAAGAWCNANLLRWGVVPRVPCLLNVGSHIVFKTGAVAASPDAAAAALLQNADGRVVFFIPWNGQWLFGTTESVLAQGEPRNLRVPSDDKVYLMDAAKLNLDLITPEDNVGEFFCGVRTMPLRLPAPGGKLEPAWRSDPFASPFYVRQGSKEVISALSRETVIDESLPGLFSIYGGKYTTYRAQSEKLGALLGRRLGAGANSTTQSAESWFLSELLHERPELFRTSASLRQL